jgi:transposase
MIGPTISASGTTQILVATKPVDFRKQADSLAALVQVALGADPFLCAVYVFRAKRADRVKLIWWDGTPAYAFCRSAWKAGSSPGRASRTA